jgi:hypothetical protein
MLYNIYHMSIRNIIHQRNNKNIKYKNKLKPKMYFMIRNEFRVKSPLNITKIITNIIINIPKNKKINSIIIY